MPDRSDRESAFALEAYNLYLQLPKPRKLKDLAGLHSTTPSGKPGRPFKYNVIRHWSTRHKWAERAEEFDRECATQEQHLMMEFRRQEVFRRERRRLEAADVQATMALGFLTYPDDWPDEEKRGQPRALDSKDPVYLQVASQYLKQAFDTERLDLGQATSRHENLGAGSGGTGESNKQIVVVTPEGLSELRDLVQQIKSVAPKTLAQGAAEQIVAQDDAIEAEYEVVQ